MIRENIQRSAVFSKCRSYRYLLRRVWMPGAPLVTFIGLNPSLADESQDDPTCRVCMNYAHRWGYGGLLLTNLYAYCATYPKYLFGYDRPVGSRNDFWLQQSIKAGARVLCVWGYQGANVGRANQVLAMIKSPYCLVRLKSGAPGHPLYKSAQLKPIPYSR